MMKIFPHTMTMSFGLDKETEINRYVIPNLTGIPNEKQTTPRPLASGDREGLAKLRAELWLKRGEKSDQLVTKHCW